MMTTLQYLMKKLNDRFKKNVNMKVSIKSKSTK